MDKIALRNTINKMCDRVSQSMRKILTTGPYKLDATSDILRHLTLKRTFAPHSITIQTELPDYSYFVIHGRGPGKMPPVNKLVDWCRRKNIESLKWAIAKKIAKEGTKMWRQHGERPFLTPVENMVTMLSQVVKEAVITETYAKAKQGIYNNTNVLDSIEIKM